MSWTAILMALVVATSGTPAAALAPLSPSRAQVAPLKLRPCAIKDFEGKTNALRCGTHAVFENRATRRGRTLPLKVILLPAREGPSRGVVYVFAGGPGEAATEYAQWLPLSWENRNHDVVVIDPRGTGDGHRLDCERPVSPVLQERLLSSSPFMEKCHARLSRKADLSQYSTAATVQDVDEIRRALGHDNIILRGGSYGSRAAIAYIKMFGRHVSRAVLTGVFPFENRAPIDAIDDQRNALAAVFADCAIDKACHAAFPDPQEDFDIVRQRLRREPAMVAIKNPDTGQPETVLLTDRKFGYAIAARLGSIESGRTIPQVLKRARAGDFGNLVQPMVAPPSHEGGSKGNAWGLYYSVTCSEDVARTPLGDIERAAARAISGVEQTYEMQIICKNWPRTTLPTDYFKPFRSNVPVLLISGDMDPVTPPRWGEMARRSFPNSVHLVVPAAHSFPRDRCMAAIGEQFMRTGNVKTLDARCIDQMTKPAFAGAG
jgi:pimeloyl-ACP methyl ester carboxylesterase